MERECLEVEEADADKVRDRRETIKREARDSKSVFVGRKRRPAKNKEEYAAAPDLTVDIIA
ncbi:conserved hypothetical protein [Ricinus communis]|uniref:Uncharacterized protein n=1 Tax=Ricinus communis TaxID=3988 RepID=B9R9N4_RICCO|nr:conserved hypothetical protein [Ricinus communis]